MRLEASSKSQRGWEGTIMVLTAGKEPKGNRSCSCVCQCDSRCILGLGSWRRLNADLRGIWTRLRWRGFDLRSRCAHHHWFDGGNTVDSSFSTSLLLNSGVSIITTHPILRNLKTRDPTPVTGSATAFVLLSRSTTDAHQVAVPSLSNKRSRKDNNTYRRIEYFYGLIQLRSVPCSYSGGTDGCSPRCNPSTLRPVEGRYPSWLDGLFRPCVRLFGDTNAGTLQHSTCLQEKRRFLCLLKALRQRWSLYVWWKRSI